MKKLVILWMDVTIVSNRVIFNNNYDKFLSNFIIRMSCLKNDRKTIIKSWNTRSFFLFKYFLSEFEKVLFNCPLWWLWSQLWRLVKRTWRNANEELFVRKDFTRGKDDEKRLTDITIDYKVFYFKNWYCCGVHSLSSVHIFQCSFEKNSTSKFPLLFH